MKGFLLKIQNLPENKRKIIFWVVMVILAIILLMFYVNNAREIFKKIDLDKTKEELQFPFLEEELKKLPNIEIPKIEVPEINQETLQELEKMMEKMPTESTYPKPIE